MISADLIADLESCQRRGYYSRDYFPRRLHPTELTRQAIYSALTSEREDVGEFAGEEVIRLCGDVGLDVKDSDYVYDIGAHHACIADIVATWARYELGANLERLEPQTIGNLSWTPNCLRNGSRLLRLGLVDHFADERSLSESRSWFSVGEVAVFDLPMDIYLVSLGASRGGKRHSAWTKGLLHPRNRKLRFKKQIQKIQGFKESWLPIWREDHAEISRETWLNTMQEDGALQDLVMTVKVEPFAKEKREEILGYIQRKAETLAGLRHLPDPNYSACDWPRPCFFRTVCFAPFRITPAELGFPRRD